MRPILILFVAAVCAEALPAQRQNFVRNGDFSSATLAPWRASGYAFNPGLAKADVDGTGPSACYAASPGGQNSTPPWPTHWIEQKVTFAPVDYELSFDLAQIGQLVVITPSRPKLEVFVGSTRLGTYTFSGLALRRKPSRQRVCLRFRLPSSGSQALRFGMSSPFKATSRTSRLFIDNVNLRLARPPLFCIRGERILGRAVAFEVRGTPLKPFALWMSPALLRSPLKVPGINNDWMLDLKLLIPWFQQAFDARGGFAVKLNIPKITALAGVRLYWQGLELGPAGPTFGWESMQAFYL